MLEEGWAEGIVWVRRCRGGELEIELESCG
jgi:hypothetical protein